jgi:hypothetical protein
MAFYDIEFAEWGGALIIYPNPRIPYHKMPCIAVKNPQNPQNARNRNPQYARDQLMLG